MTRQNVPQIIPKNIPALLAVLLLSGCGSAPPATQRVDVPVYVPCVKDRPVRPAYEFGTLPATASDGEKVIALARDWPRGRKYESELEAALAGCLVLYGSVTDGGYGSFFSASTATSSWPSADSAPKIIKRDPI